MRLKAGWTDCVRVHVKRNKQLFKPFVYINTWKCVPIIPSEMNELKKKKIDTFFFNILRANLLRQWFSHIDAVYIFINLNITIYWPPTNECLSIIHLVNILSDVFDYFGRNTIVTTARQFIFVLHELFITVYSEYKFFSVPSLSHSVFIIIIIIILQTSPFFTSTLIREGTSPKS